MNIKFTIDGREVEMPADQTILQAARQLGLEIPTLCFLEQCGPATSCLVCLVNIHVNGQRRLVPACATKVQAGLVVESETAEVYEARRTALELLFSDHVGDCLSPCQRICPLQLNIPAMLRQIQTGQFKEAIVTVKSALPLPAVLGRLCHHPCENGCRRNSWDSPAAIRELERHVADADLASSQPYLPRAKSPTGKSVAIVGAGPTGLAAAYDLVREGHTCSIIDRHPQAGGALRAEIEKQTLPETVLQAELRNLERLGLRFMLRVTLGQELVLNELARDFDAVLLTIGALPAGGPEVLGLPRTAVGIVIQPDTYQTRRPGVFAAGSAVKAIPQLVRAMSEGRAAARCVHQFLMGQKIERPERPFSSVMGRLEDGEISLFLNGVSPAGRCSPSCGAAAGFNCHEATAEAHRCLHCDCRSVGHCELQRYAEIYHADPNRFRTHRRHFEQQRQPGGIIFEPGKCILCGICVQLAEQAREPLGLTFIGRGFDVRVGAPFNHTITEGLQRVAAECVEHCPTGALVFDDTPGAMKAADRDSSARQSQQAGASQRSGGSGDGAERDPASSPPA